MKDSREHIYPDIQFTIWCSSLSFLLYIQHIHFCQVDHENGFPIHLPLLQPGCLGSSTGLTWTPGVTYRMFHTAIRGIFVKPKPIRPQACLKTSNCFPIRKKFKLQSNTWNPSHVAPNYFWGISSCPSPQSLHCASVTENLLLVVRIQHADAAWVHVGSFA